MKVVLKVKAKHAELFDYMREHGLDNGKMAAMLGISKATLWQMLTFRWRPTDNYQSVRIAKRLEEVLGKPIEKLYPPVLTEQITKNHLLKDMLQKEHIVRKEIDLAFLPSYQVPEISYMPDFEEFEVKDIVSKVVQTLTPKEQAVLTLRFGLDGEGERTLEEVAAAIGTGKERVRQIEAKALLKMKHPSRKKFLKDFLTRDTEADKALRKRLKESREKREKRYSEKRHRRLK